MEIAGIDGEVKFVPRTMAVMASINFREILIMGGKGEDEKKYGDAWILNMEGRKPRMTQIFESHEYQLSSRCN